MLSRFVFLIFYSFPAPPTFFRECVPINFSSAHAVFAGEERRMEKRRRQVHADLQVCALDSLC